MVNALMQWKLGQRFRKHFPGTDFVEVEGYFKFSEKEKLLCEYCNAELLARDEKPWHNVVSIDHKVPLSWGEDAGGINAFSNIAICCAKCNICKGTMKAETYKALLRLLDSDKEIKEQILSEMFSGRYANKMDRLTKTEGKKEIGENGKVMLSEFV